MVAKIDRETLTGLHQTFFVQVVMIVRNVCSRVVEYIIGHIMAESIPDAGSTASIFHSALDLV
jgi:hypothetical protein